MAPDPEPAAQVAARWARFQGRAPDPAKLGTALPGRLGAVLDFLVEFADQFGVQPRYAALRRHFGWTHNNSVRSALWQLYQRGYIGPREDGFGGYPILRRRDGSPYRRGPTPPPSSPSDWRLAACAAFGALAEAVEANSPRGISTAQAALRRLGFAVVPMHAVARRVPKEARR